MEGNTVVGATVFLKPDHIRVHSGILGISPKPFGPVTVKNDRTDYFRQRW